MSKVYIGKIMPKDTPDALVNVISNMTRSSSWTTCKTCGVTLVLLTKRGMINVEENYIIKNGYGFCAKCK